VAEDKAQFGPCVHHLRRCLRRADYPTRAETGIPVPKMPILFNKFKQRAQPSGGSIAVSKEKATNFDYEAEP